MDTIPGVGGGVWPSEEDFLKRLGLKKNTLAQLRPADAKVAFGGIVGPQKTCLKTGGEKKHGASTGWVHSSDIRWISTPKNFELVNKSGVQAGGTKAGLQVTRQLRKRGGGLSITVPISLECVEIP